MRYGIGALKNRLKVKTRPELEEGIPTGRNRRVLCCALVLTSSSPAGAGGGPGCTRAARTLDSAWQQNHGHRQSAGEARDQDDIITITSHQQLVSSHLMMLSY